VVYGTFHRNVFFCFCFFLGQKSSWVTDINFGLVVASNSVTFLLSSLAETEENVFMLHLKFCRFYLPSFSTKLKLFMFHKRPKSPHQVGEFGLYRLWAGIALNFQ